MLPGEAGINVRKTARYASKDCDPLHVNPKLLLVGSSKALFVSFGPDLPTTSAYPGVCLVSQ